MAKREIMRSFLEVRFKKGGFVRNVAWLGSGMFAGHIAVVAASPVLTRIYSIEAFGQYGVVAAVVGVIGLFTTWRYELAIPIARNSEEVGRLLRVCVALGTATVAILGLALLLAGKRVSGFFGLSDRPEMIWLVTLGLLVVTLHRIGTYQAIQRGIYRRMAGGSVAQGVSTVGAQLLIGVLSGGASGGLVYGYLIGHVVATVYLLGSRRVTVGPFLRGWDIRGLSCAARTHARYAFLASPAAMFGALAMRLPLLAIAASYGPRAAGLYTLTERIIQTPMKTLGRSVAQVYLGKVGQQLAGHRGQLYSSYLRASRGLSLLATVPALALLFFGPQMFGFVFGSEWREAGVYAQLMVVLLIGQFSIGPLSQTLNAVGRHDVQLVLEAMRLALIGLSVVPGLLGWVSPRATVGLVGFLGAVGYLGMWIVNLRVLRRIEMSEEDARA